MGCGQSADVNMLREENARLQEFAKEQQTRAAAAEKDLRQLLGADVQRESNAPKTKFVVSHLKQPKQTCTVEIDLERNAYSLVKKAASGFQLHPWEITLYRDYKSLSSSKDVPKQALGKATADKKLRSIPAFVYDPPVEKSKTIGEIYPPNKSTTAVGPVTVELPLPKGKTMYTYKECQVRPNITISELHSALAGAYPEFYKEKKKWDMWLVTRQRHENFRLGAGYYSVDAYFSYEPAGDASEAVLGTDLELRAGDALYMMPIFDETARKIEAGEIAGPNAATGGKKEGNEGGEKKDNKK